MKLKLRCSCGRNLAEVTHSRYDPVFTGDGIVVRERPNVRKHDYRPWPRHAPAADWHQRTYAWDCRCGQRWERRHDRIRDAWDTAAGGLPEYRRHNAAADDGRVVSLILGRDL
jgi:hypothetical protein